MPKNGSIETSVFKNERKIDTIFDRFISSGPGPGKYNENRTEFIPKKKFKHRKGNAIINSERRFLYEPEYIKNPGPGKYFTNNDPRAINGPKAKFDSNFGTKSDREINDFLIQHENSPLYNLQEYQAIAKQKVIARAPNNFTIMYK